MPSPTQECRAQTLDISGLHPQHPLAGHSQTIKIAKLAITDSPETTDNDREISSSDARPSYQTTEFAAMAAQCRSALILLDKYAPNFDPHAAYHPSDILAMPFHLINLPSSLQNLPRRRNNRVQAQIIASCIYPTEKDSLAALIYYEKDRVRIRAWVTLQNNYVLLAAKGSDTEDHSRASGQTHEDQYASFPARLRHQGPWNPAKFPVSTGGIPAVVPYQEITSAHDIYPTLDIIAFAGTDPTRQFSLDGQILWNGSCLDLCRVVIGSVHISRVLATISQNQVIRHVLLGNSTIGTAGAQAIADFSRQMPTKIETWYLPGNHLTAAGLRILVNGLVSTSPISALTGLWLKRNPLTLESAITLVDLITLSPHLRTLDLEQTELGDHGVTHLFTILSEHIRITGRPLPLRNIFLTGNGMGLASCSALARFLEISGLVGGGPEALYLSCNPLGDQGILALAAGLAKAPQMKRLLLQSTGMTSEGAIGLCAVIRWHPGIFAVDLGQSYLTAEHSLALNYIDDNAVPELTALILRPGLQYLVLGYCAISHQGLDLLNSSVSRSELLFFRADPIDKETIGTIMPTQRNFIEGTVPRERRRVTEAERAATQRMTLNVKAVYGNNVSYADFKEFHKKWIVSNRMDVGIVDSQSRRSRRR